VSWWQLALTALQYAVNVTLYSLLVLLVCAMIVGGLYGLLCLVLWLGGKIYDSVTKFL
jgi:hypothetical protein